MLFRRSSFSCLAKYISSTGSLLLELGQLGTTGIACKEMLGAGLDMKQEAKEIVT